MNTLLTRWSIAVLGLLLTGPAIAQTLPAATGRLKPTRSPHSAAAEHPRNVQTRVDGRLASPHPGPGAEPVARMGACTSLAPAGFRVQRAVESNLPVLIEVAPGTAHHRVASLPPAEASVEFLDELQAVLTVRAPRQEFAVSAVSQPDAVGQTHVRLRQTWAGLPVYGSEVIVHLGPDGQPTCLTGRYFRSPQAVATVARLAGPEAVRRAEAALRPHTRVRALSAAEQRLLPATAPATELVIYHLDERAAPALAWHVTTYPNVLERWETFVDATTGAVLTQYASSCTVNGPRTAVATDLNGVNQTIHTYEFNNTFYLLDASRPMFNNGASTLPDRPAGGILTLNAQNTSSSNLSLAHNTSANNTWSGTGRPAAVSAHDNAARAYEYYRTTFNRNSIDGQGGSILSIVHVADDNGGGLDNAYWNGQAMFYGDGATTFFPLAGGLDVGGHEMTHGVVQHSANLEYRNQSGALNEHMADVFGAMIDRNDWLMGEDIVRPGAFPGGALRSFQDPHNGAAAGGNGWQPRTMSEIYSGTQDNGGVHINSGIPNWAFYKFATAVSKDHGEKIWYRALTTYLTRSSQFIDLRISTIRAATDLYGAASADVAALNTAFNDVGIGGTSPGGPLVLPTNPGTELLLAFNTDPTLTGSLYLGAGANFRQITATPVASKPSATDDGGAAVFVDNQHHMRAVQLTGPVNETVLSSQGVWRNAAVSKDGNKLAAVTIDQDTALYVFDLTTGQGARFQLYIPTTGGTTSTGVLYADALEWDYTGQYVIYDAYNVLQNASGQDYDFWNINYLRVWNNGANTWGNGNIEQLVPSLPNGISIGNPVLSKKSPNILAFDRFDATATAGPFSVMALNTETGDVGTIFSGSDVAGTPTYSKLDNLLMFTALAVSGDTVIAQQGMAADKITPTGNPTIAVTSAKWPVLIAQGTRTLPMAAPAALAEAIPLRAWPNPAHDALTLEADGMLAVTLLDLTGRPVQTATVGPGAASRLPLAGLAAGTYLLRATDAQGRATTRRIVKE